MSQSNGARGSPTKGSYHNSPSKSSSRTESCVTYDSDWTSELSDSLGHSRDHEVFSSNFQRSVANLPGPKEPSVKAAEYVQGLPPQEDRLQSQESIGQRRRRVWSESCGSKRRNQSRNWSSDGTGFSSVESVSSTFSSLQDSGSSSNWVDAWDNNVFDTTVVPEADQTIVEISDGNDLEEDFVANNPLSKQSTVSEDSIQEGLTTTLTEENLKESLTDKRHLARTLSNSDILDLASSMTTAVSRKRELFLKSESWNESCDSELSVKSVTSVDELLDVWNDPEEFLLNLGFGLSTADPLERIPQRFLSEESSAAGISVEKFQQDVRERERGYDFCLTGGLRGLERFLTLQLKNSGLQFSPFASPTHSPLSERLPSFAEPGRPNGLGIGHNGDHMVVHPLPINPSYEQSRSEILYSRTRFPSRKSSQDSYLSTDDSLSGSEAAFDSDLSSSGDWSDQREEARRAKVKGKRLQLTTSNLDTVEEELESQLRAKSPCPHPRSPNPIHLETASEKVDTAVSPSIRDESFEEKAVESASSLKSSIPHKLEVIKAINVESLKTAQDSFEFEEISVSDVQADDSISGARNGHDRKESLTRNESQQSDSSGFADELTDSVSPASPQHERAGEELGEDLPRKSEEAESLEPNNNLKARDLSDKLSDIPHAHRTSENESNPDRVDEDSEQEDNSRPYTRPRSGTFPSVSAIPSGPEGPKSVVEVLEALEKNYRKAEMEVQRRKSGEGVEKRRRLFSKMDTVDLDNYSFTGGKHCSEIETGEVEGVFGDESALESAIEEGNSKTPEETNGAVSLKEEVLEKLESEVLCDTLDEDKNTASSQRARADQLVDKSLGLDSASAGLEDKSQAIETQRELQDLKLMQRALFKYKQDLWELEEWSTQMYNEEGDSVTTQQVRKELESLGNLRKNVKREVEKMESVIESQMKEVISQRGSMDNLSERFAHWSLNHIDVLNKMVTLMKEQDSLRQHLLDMKSKEKEITGQEPSAPSLSKNVYKTLNKSELVTELVNTQLELARLRVMARTEMTAAIAEMKKCILSDIRREVDRELRLMQWQIKDRDEQIEQLKHLLQQSGQEFPSSNKGVKSVCIEEMSSGTEDVMIAKDVGESEVDSSLKKTDAAEETCLKTESQKPAEIITEVKAEM